MDDTIEEGRLALLTLERQLGGGGGGGSGISGNQQEPHVTTNRTTSTLSSERRLLDQAPRDLRLNNRMGSPLGLTIEELDDRGLLEGGMVPNYYASSRQRGRRPLEMKKRSSRLLERGKETITKMTNALFHMVRVLNKRGLHMEEYCLPRDTKCTGFVPKSHFVSILRNIGLPFGSKDLNDIILRYTSAPKYDAVDYHAFLRDAGVKLKHDANKQTDLEDTRDGSIQSDLSAYTTFLFDMKRMLLEAVQRLGKQTEDVYRMFARWDNEGSGNITATQFLRVLMRLHVDLSDQDQDFLVELLDTTSMGRIDFESLLSFCLSDLSTNNNDTNVKSPHPIRALTDDNINDLTASTIVPSNNGYNHAMDGHGESSVGSNNKNAQGRRPHTASPSRHDLQFIGGGRGSPDRLRSDQSAFGSTGHNHHGGINTAPVIQRPTTASGRVASSVEYRQSRQSKGLDRENVDGLNVSSGPNYHRTRPQSAAGMRGVSDYVADLPDDVINDEDDYMGGYLGGTNNGGGVGVGGGNHPGIVLTKTNSQLPGRGDRTNAQGPGPSARDDLYENAHTPSHRTNKETGDRPRPASSSAASHHRHQHVLRDVDLNVYVAEAKDLSRQGDQQQQLRHEREYKQRTGDSVSMVPESGSSHGGGEPERGQDQDRDRGRENDDGREDDNRENVMDRVVDREVKGERGSRGVSPQMGHPVMIATHLGHVSQGRPVQQQHQPQQHHQQPHQQQQQQQQQQNQGYEDYENNDESMELFPDGASFNDNTLLTEPDDYTQGIPAIQRDPWRIDSLDSSLENGYPSSIHGGTGGGRFSPQPPIILTAGGNHPQGRQGQGARPGQGLRQGPGVRPGVGVSLDNQLSQRGGRSQQNRDDPRHPRGASRDGRDQGFGLGSLPQGVVYSSDPSKIYYPDGRTDVRIIAYNDQNDGLGGAPYDLTVDPSSDNNYHQHQHQQYHSGDGTYLGVGGKMGGPMGGALNNNNNNNNNMGNNDLLITDYVHNMTSVGGMLNSDQVDTEAMSIPADESPVLEPRYRDNVQGPTGGTGTGGLFGQSQGGGVHFDNESSFSEPIDHLNLLASQTLAAVRDLVLKRHRTGNKTVAEIYRHFDRKGKHFFTVLDFMQATADLRIETTERVATLAVAQLALDSPRDRVSLGEFNVFVSDITHHELEDRVRRQAVELFEKQGRAFQHTLHSIFTESIHEIDPDQKQGSSSGAGQAASSQGRQTLLPRQGQQQFGFVSPQAFISTLKKLGFKLSSSDVDRLVVRFDVYGQGTGCSSSRFIRMIESSDIWQQAEVALAHQEVAAEEASTLRTQLKKQAYNGTTDTPNNNNNNNNNNSSSTSLNEEMISMAEYLGIKVISERHLLWIVRDALNAPLPAQWAVLNDSKGKAFYYNRSTNQSRWDHPLDPHFRKLRDQHRAQYSYPQQLQVGVGQPGSTPMFLQGDQGMMRQGGVMDDERGLNIHNHMLPVVVNGTTSSQQTSHQYNPTVSSPMTITSNSHHNYSQTQPQQTSVQYNHHYNNNLSHNYPHGGNNNEGGNHRMISEGRNSESRNDSKQSHGQGLAPQFSNPLTPHILPSATQTAPKIFHQHFEAKVQEVVGNGVHVTSSSSTRPVSAPLEYHHHHHSHTPQLPPPRAEGKPTPSNPLMTTAMLASAQTQAKLRGAGYSEYAEKMIAAEHAYRPYNWASQDNSNHSNQAKKTTAVATSSSSSAYNHPTSSGTKVPIQKPRASSATVGRRTTTGLPGQPSGSSSGGQYHPNNHSNPNHPTAGSGNQDMDYHHRSSSTHHDRPGSHHSSQGKRTGPGASTLPPADKAAQGKGGYYDLQQHQAIINMTAGLQESDHNQLRYNQGGQQGTYNQGGYMQSSSGQGGNNGYYNNHSYNQSGGSGQGQVEYNDGSDSRLDRTYGPNPGPGTSNETKLASMFSSDVITRLDLAFGAKR